MNDSAIICDEVIDTDEESNDAKLSPKDDNETNFNGKSNLQNSKFLYFTCIFINYYSIINSC